jgi:hypothetical protein
MKLIHALVIPQVGHGNEKTYLIGQSVFVMPKNAI